MSQMQTSIDAAVTLMQDALGRLDRAGETTAAIHLQHAIDVAMKVPILTPEQELSPELIDRMLGNEWPGSSRDKPA
jgi:hypothetical protein